MPTETKFNFDNSYLQLPEHFYEIVETELIDASHHLLFNTSLANELGLSVQPEVYVKYILDNQGLEKKQSFAQAYAGHQFGHFNRLGDGRAIMLGEHITPENKRYDIQLKGGGMTKFSRGGDGKATLTSMLREYLMSEAMHHLGVPTSRSLAVIKTGEPVYRETVHEGASLIRVMKSHLRVGTFQYASHLGSAEDVQKLTSYTINRLFPELSQSTHPGIALLESVMNDQIELVAHWMSVGFIHGVMNTDNVSISGETFDYGPCAFMNAYHPKTVFSSIDRNGRYAFGNQPNITKWNIMRFAEALLPIIHTEQKTAIALAQVSIEKFDALWNATYYRKMLQKLGFSSTQRSLYPLVDELLEVMQNNEMDYTNTFVALAEEDNFATTSTEAFKLWKLKWRKAINEHTTKEEAKALMKKVNPRVIPRNHLVEEALNEANQGNFSPFEELQKVVSHPFNYVLKDEKYTQPPKPTFDRNYQTFCGT